MKEAYDIGGNLLTVPVNTPTRNKGGIRYLLTDDDKAREAAKEAKYLSESETRADEKVIKERVKEYGTPTQQLEFLAENGIEAFVTRQLKIKQKHPK